MQTRTLLLIIATTFLLAGCPPQPSPPKEAAPPAEEVAPPAEEVAAPEDAAAPEEAAPPAQETAPPAQEVAPPAQETAAPEEAAPLDFDLDDLEVVRELTDAEYKEDSDWIASHANRMELIERLTTEDVKEREEVAVAKAKVETAKEELDETVEQILKKRAERKVKKLFEEKIAGKLKKDSKLTEQELKELLVKAAQGELTKEELKEVLIKKLGFSAEEVEEIAAEGRKQALLEKVLEVIKDEKLKKELLEKDARGELTEEELKKILIEQGGLTEEEVEEIARKGEEKALLSKILKETTTLTDEEIKAVVAEIQQIQQETEELRKKIAAATSAEEVRQILEEAGDVTEEEIAAIVKKKEKVLALEQSFLEETLAKIFSRLKRNRELGIDDAFCTNHKATLDNLLVRPSYFETGSSVIAEETHTQVNYDFGVLEDPFGEYLGVLLVQIEGNADIRGTNAYNKALTERRWTVPMRLLRSLYFDKQNLRGLSRGEECQLPGGTGGAPKDWWKRNRRTDYIFKLR